MGATGWLSPTGEHTPCTWREHCDTAERLHTALFAAEHAAFRAEDGFCSCDAHLWERGWVVITSESQVCHYDEPATRLTQAQLDALWDIALASSDAALLAELVRIGGGEQ